MPATHRAREGIITCVFDSLFPQIYSRGDTHAYGLLPTSAAPPRQHAADVAATGCNGACEHFP